MTKGLGVVKRTQSIAQDDPSRTHLHFSLASTGLVLFGPKQKPQKWDSESRKQQTSGCAVPEGSGINIIVPKSGLRWPSLMPLDLGQRRLRSISRNLFLSLNLAVFRGLGCWLTWREPGCDSFATVLFGFRQNCSIKVTTRASPG